MDNNWDNFDAVLGRVPEPLSTRGAGQGLVVFYGMAKPVLTPLIGPARHQSFFSAAASLIPPDCENVACSPLHLGFWWTAGTANQDAPSESG